MRRAALLALALAAGCDWLTGDFRLTGTVDISPALRARAPKSNSMLFVIARNTGGVPLAVQRIVNPEFPASFSMGSAELLVPAIRRNEALEVVAVLNAHGSLGTPQPGDLEGRAAGPARPGDRGVRVLIEHSR